MSWLVDARLGANGVEVIHPDTVGALAALDALFVGVHLERPTTWHSIVCVADAGTVGSIGKTRDLRRFFLTVFAARRHTRIEHFRARPLFLSDRRSISASAAHAVHFRPSLNTFPCSSVHRSLRLLRKLALQRERRLRSVQRSLPLVSRRTCVPPQATVEHLIVEDE